jgi:hypothetical protein
MHAASPGLAGDVGLLEEHDAARSALSESWTTTTLHSRGVSPSVWHLHAYRGVRGVGGVSRYERAILHGPWPKASAILPREADMWGQVDPASIAARGRWGGSSR